MNAFSTRPHRPERTMTQYETYPQIWTPSVMPSLFVVRVPATVDSLDEPAYKTLMQDRVSWMIGRWMESFNQQNAQRLLATKLGELNSNQDYPLLNSDETEAAALIQWQQAWSETLVFHSEAFSQAIWLLGISFPATVMNESHPEFQDFLELHQTTHLEEWLNDLSA